MKTLAPKLSAIKLAAFWDNRQKKQQQQQQTNKKLIKIQEQSKTFISHEES